jgi:caffeoyl-CoA O-methyltransferase
MADESRQSRMPSLQKDGIEEYCEAHTSPEPPYLARVAERTIAEVPGARMMVGQLEGQFLAFLVHLARPAHVLEIGTFTGYSALAMAAALPPGARITSLDIDPGHVAIAREHIAASPYADRIEVIEGPAIESLRSLPGPFDLVFIDADKGGYRRYYEDVLPKLSPHGAIVVDNVLWSGRVVDPTAEDNDTEAIRAFNDHVAADSRVDCVMLPVRDGVLLIRRR